MTQELLDLRNSITEGRYEDALVLIDELEGMSRQVILRNIQSFLLRLLMHLIKNQIEQRLTKSWAASIRYSIRHSIRQIKKLNLQDNKISYYIKTDEWQTMLEDEFEAAIRDASLEVRDGSYSESELLEMVDREQILLTAQTFLALTYEYSVRELPGVVNEYLAQLPGGEDWKQGRQ
ncbi:MULTISPECIES: DUF29 family protein [Aerosakkonema]|uniref:DUF29 family protein n=1 Tax=Aerosakkonema TaxID=1246629 RepID=UPI0035B808C4